MARLDRIRRSSTISFASKFKLYQSLTTSVFPMAVKHDPCSLTRRKGSRPSRPNALRRLLRISCLEHETSHWVRNKIDFLVGPQEHLATAKRRKLAWFRHVTRRNSFSKTILHGTLEGT